MDTEEQKFNPICSSSRAGFDNMDMIQPIINVKSKEPMDHESSIDNPSKTASGFLSTRFV